MPGHTPTEPAEVYLWPCNVQAWAVFVACRTQWRVGMAGATGLDYAAVRVVMDLLDVGKKHRAGVFAGVRVAENAALRVWAATK